MRKIFFLLFITVSAAASAQQQDIFDIQQHLQSKKPLFPKLQNPVPFIKTTSVPPVSVPDHSLSLSQGAVVEYGNGTMPCIKVDMAQFCTMPNVVYMNKAFIAENLTQIQPGQIPNGAIPRLRFDIK